MFELTPRRHEMLSVYLLGFGTLFLYIGYVSQSFISESIIHSIHSKEPSRISAYAGYYGQAFHYTAFALSSLVTPSLQHYVPSKWILTIASALFAIYYLGFFYINNFYFYFSQVLMGIGYAFYNNGEGAYLSEHSSRRTIESNTGAETAIGHASMFIGGLVLVLLYSLMPQHVTAGFLSFSEEQIRIIYGAFFGLNVVSVLIFALLPTKQIDSIASKSQAVLPSFKQQIKQMGTAVISTNMLVLIPFFIYMGLFLSFLLAVYPTTLAFTSSLSTDVYIVAVYSLGMGAAEIFGGLFLRPIVKRLGPNGLLFTMAAHFLAVSTVLVLVFLSVPTTATIRPTADPTVLIKPGRIIVAIVGFLLGIADFTMTMSRAVICQVAVPQCRMQVFSISRLYQCIASCIILVLTPYMSITVWLIALAVGLLLGSTAFIIVSRRTQIERQNSIAPRGKATSQVEIEDQLTPEL